MNIVPFALSPNSPACTSGDIIEVLLNAAGRVTGNERIELGMLRRRSLSMVLLLLGVTFATIQFGIYEAMASTDQDGDGLITSIEYLLNTGIQDWDSDGDGLPDGWEWKYGLDPLNGLVGEDGQTGDKDGDQLTNLQEYQYGMPSNWDDPNTPDLLDNGVWWNGTIPVNDWNEEDAMQFNQPNCGDAGSDGQGGTILCDEDPPGDICNDGFDNDYDGMIDSQDSNNDGDAVCGSDDDDGDGLIDEDPFGFDTDADGMDDGWEVANGFDPTSSTGIDGPDGDPDGDGLTNIYEYINPSWDTQCNGADCFWPGPPSNPMTGTESPCNPVTGDGPNGCATLVAEVDFVTQTDPNNPDTDGDGINDGDETSIWLTDPTAADTDGDGISDGVEVASGYGNPLQATDPRNNNTDGDVWDDGEEDINFNGQIDGNESDPTRREDTGDFDNDGIQNWEENLTCSLWNVADTDYGGVNDGDERNALHLTDPCDSMIDVVISFTQWDAASSTLTVTDSSAFSPNGGNGWYENGGVLTEFTFGFTNGNDLVGVSQAPGAGDAVMAKNGSWCRMDAEVDGTILTTRQYCDDDFYDTDGDGLADWQERTGYFGYFSDFTLVDSDADGQNDFDEVMGGTDPLEPCVNTLDDDFDGANNYFENTTGCALSFIGVLSGGNDPYVTDPFVFDTDNGGVGDLQEYFDGTNPENVPSDDINPQDTDGDGIPDSIENLTGTDWRNPDTDGGGLSDYVECPPPFWSTLCNGSGYDPFDPTDDVIDEDVVFWGNTTSADLDRDSPMFWRVSTYDNYTGGGYGVDASPHPRQILTPNYVNTTWIADSAYSNGTIDWTIEFNAPMASGNVPMPHNWEALSVWNNPSAKIERADWTGTLSTNVAPLSSVDTQAKQLWFDQADLDLSEPFTPSSHELALPSYFSDGISQESIVSDIVQGAITDSGATSGYGQADALAEHLRQGNGSIFYSINYDGSGVNSSEDIVWHILNNSLEGTCSDFVTVFVTMARLAGIPARKVSGYLNGERTPEGYLVRSDDGGTWAEVHLRSSTTGADMGWVPISPCPQPLSIEIVNLTWTPDSWDRDASTNITIEGNLIYSINATGIDNITVRGYLSRAPTDPTASAQTDSSMWIGIGNNTDVNGHFIISGIPAEAIEPGFQKIVVINTAKGYVPPRVHQFPGHINVTDDSVLTHTSSTSIGQGATTQFTGMLEMESPPQHDVSQLGTLTVQLDYTSAVNGVQTLQADVGRGGGWSFDLTLDPTEPLGPLTFTVTFAGWQDPDESYAGSPDHLRASSLIVNATVTLAPDLTATVEGNDVNNSILLVGDFVYVNGTATSTGASPTPMDGLLELGFRTNGSGLEYFVVFNMSVNGSFTIAFLLNGSNLNIPAGMIDVRLRFYPTALDSTDDADIADDYLLRSYLTFSYFSNPQMRGADVTVVITAYDHRGISNDVNLTGTFDHFFDGALVNTSIDPNNPISATWATQSTMVPGDYVIFTQFGGSTLYVASSGVDTMLIQGDADLQISLSTTWIHVGDVGYLEGIFVDAELGTTILGNETEIILQVIGQEQLRDNMVGNGSVNMSTGQFNITIMMPSGLASGAYFVQVVPMGMIEPPYYMLPQPLNFTIGIESEFALSVVDADGDAVGGLNLLNAPLSGVLEFGVFAFDIGNGTATADRPIHAIFDYNGSNTALPDEMTQWWSIDDGRGGITMVGGSANFSWTIPGGTAPGTYMMRIYIDDDLTDLVTDPNPARWTGNETFVDVTVQVPSQVNITWIQPEVTAGAFFRIAGQIEDGDDASRPFNGPISIKVYFDGAEGEALIASSNTAANGSFNISVPTDSALDGVASGDRAITVETIDGSNIYYLPSQAQAMLHVTGVGDFVEINHTAPILVNRGDSLEFIARLVEASATCSACAYDTPIDVRMKNKPVTFLFDETWLATTVTDQAGGFQFSHTVPYDQPLGMVILSFYYNGSQDVHPVTKDLPTTMIRSLTLIVLDPITDNPVAGTTFNISGSVLSDNASGLMNRNGVPLLTLIDVLLDGNSVQFLDGQITANGDWNATVYVDPSIAAGTHQVNVTYNPAVPFYLGSLATSSIDIRGFAVMDFIAPGDLQQADRKDRGDTIDVIIRVLDNAGQPVTNANVQIDLLGTAESAAVITNATGLASTTINIPVGVDPGIFELFASWPGTVSTTGLLAGNATTSFVVMAYTVVTLDSIEGSMVAGEVIWVNGTLLDDTGAPLLGVDGLAAGGKINLLISGFGIASAISDGQSGAYSIEYELPEYTPAGGHTISVEFLGGFMWEEPFAGGDVENPEYYHNSSTSVQNFDVYVPTHIIILTPQGSQADRGSTLTINGSLLDIQNRPLLGRTIEVLVNGTSFTFVATNDFGFFSVFITLDDDAAIGPLDVTLRFNGDDFNLSSEADSNWFIYSPTAVSIDDVSPATLGETVIFNGSIADNVGVVLVDHQIRVLVDGVEIGLTNSSADGTWTFTWNIPMGTTFGEHIIGVRSPSQGYYRESYAESSLFIAHHSEMVLDVDVYGVNRGGTWNMSGRLYDSDDLTQTGLANETVEIFLDGAKVAEVTTLTDGAWFYLLPVDMQLARGEHTLSASFAGTLTHIASSQDVTVSVWADVSILINEGLTSVFAVRYSSEYPLEIYGELNEIGGNQEQFDNLSLSLYTEDGVLINSELNWTVIGTQLFYISALAPSNLLPGNLVLVVDFPGSDADYLLPASVNLSLLLQVDATFSLDLQPIISGQRDDIYGNITVIADDDGGALGGISVIVSLQNASGEILSRTLVTDEFGVAQIELTSNPAYSDSASYGEVVISIDTNDPRISNKSLASLQATLPESLTRLEINAESGGGGLTWGLIAALVIAAAAGILWYRRRRADVLDEIAGIFSYTAELLAHGDAAREAIFKCYEELSRVLTKHGFLRRDFETVREFEMALRSALPIQESYLVELDNVFEEARYSRHELGEQDALRASQALEGVRGELANINVSRHAKEAVPLPPQ